MVRNPQVLLIAVRSYSRCTILYAYF